jgi:2,5-diketo-D-gluconate reductase A
MQLPLFLERRALLWVSTALLASPEQQPPIVASSQAPTVLCADGSRVPFATFGVQIYDDATARELTLRALEAGFRSFFTSPEAGNQRGFALGVRDSGLPRDSLFIAGSVLSDEAIGNRAARSLTRARVEESRAALAAGGVDSLDMLLLERPGLSGGAIRGQWAALEEAQRQGWARSLGTCNFELEQIDELLRGARVRPVLSQIQYTLAIRMPHAVVLREHAARGIRLMAFSPLGGPAAILPRATVDECTEIGRRYDASPYQVALRWLVQQGVAYSVHSRVLAHLKDDLDVFRFSLSAEEMARLERLSESAPAYY